MLCLPNAAGVAWSSSAAAVPHLSTKIWSSNVNGVNIPTNFNNVYLYIYMFFSRQWKCKRHEKRMHLAHILNLPPCLSLVILIWHAASAKAYSSCGCYIFWMQKQNIFSAASSWLRRRAQDDLLGWSTSVYNELVISSGRKKRRRQESRRHREEMN